MNSTEEAFRDELKTLAYRYHVHHPFDKLLQSGMASREMLRMWASNRFYYQDTIPRKDAAILSKCPDSEIRRAWIPHIVTHDVDGALSEWLMLTRSLGLTDAEVTAGVHLLPATRFACDAYYHFCKDASWQDGMCASMTHLFAGDIHQKRIAHWPDRYPWLPSEAFVYFRNRTQTLPSEVDTTLRLLAQHYASVPNGLDRAKEILRFKQNVLWCMMDALWTHFFSKECRIPRGPRAEDAGSGAVLRILGSAAGGGFPQWNRTDPLNLQALHGGVASRLQSSYAVSSDRTHWTLINCSPDVSHQWNALRRRHPGAVLDGILLTDVQVDHVGGLLDLRASDVPLHIHCTSAMERVLSADTHYLKMLRAYTTVCVHTVIPGRGDTFSGVSVIPWSIASRHTRYAASPSDVLALSVQGPTEAVLLAPCIPEITPETAALLRAHPTLLVDGTFADADEMPHVSGHVPVSELRRHLTPQQTVHYVHVNNTTPHVAEGILDGTELTIP